MKQRKILSVFSSVFALSILLAGCTTGSNSTLKFG